MVQGKHLIANIRNFPKVEIEFCLEKMLEAVPLMGAKVVDSGCSQNPEQAYVSLDASHIALHVKRVQNQRVAFLDIFTCGSCDPVVGYEYLREQIGFPETDYKLYDRFVSKESEH